MNLLNSPPHHLNGLRAGQGRACGNWQPCLGDEPGVPPLLGVFLFLFSSVGGGCFQEDPGGLGLQAGAGKREARAAGVRHPVPCSSLRVSSECCSGDRQSGMAWCPASLPPLLGQVPLQGAAFPRSPECVFRSSGAPRKGLNDRKQQPEASFLPPGQSPGQGSSPRLRCCWQSTVLGLGTAPARCPSISPSVGHPSCLWGCRQR